ncbi:tyrosine-type recombinase/integrase [Methanobrevibacter sp.]
MISNEEYILEYVQTRDLSETTHQHLKIILKHYCKFQQNNLHTLLTEADQEEEAGIRWKNRKLKHRLIKYMNYLKKHMTLISAKTYFGAVKTFYNHYEIEIGVLPKWNTRNAKISGPISYKDLPDKEIIKHAVEISNPLMRCIILFLVSTGMAKIDMRKLTIQDFIDATQEYHNHDNIYDVVKSLREIDDDIIPVWRNRRTKTNKYFVTFNTPECTYEILNYLQKRLEKEVLTADDLLFPISTDYFTRKFIDLNNMMKLGKVGTYNRFRGHMLRKYHASNLEKNGMNRYKINVLQGKSNGKVDDVYFFEDEEDLKQEYINAIEGVLIFTDAEILKLDSPEVVMIKNENKLLKDEIKELKNDVDLIKSWWIKKEY